MTTVTPTLVLAAFLTCFGSSMLYGYNLGVFNLPKKHIKDFLSPANADEKQRVFLYSFAASTFVITGAVGAFLSGLLADSLGRKYGMMVNNLIGIVGGIFLAISYPCNAPALIFIGRGIVGLNCGLTMGLASLYLTEIAPTRMRGLLGACHQLAVVSGILISNVLTFDSLLGTAHGWAYACGMVGIPPFVQFVLMWFVPESPRYLFIKKGKHAEAIAAKLKFDPDVPSDVFAQEAQEEVTKASLQPPFRFVDIFQRQYSKAMLIACIIQVMQQASGIKAIVSFSTTLMESSGVDKHSVQYYAAGLSLVFVIGTITSVLLLDKLGRRTLLFGPTLLTILCLLGVCITTNIAQSFEDYKKTASIASVILIYVYQITFSLGLGPIPGLIVSELFCQGPRAAAYSISQCTLWIANLTVFFSYPNLERMIGGYIFLIYVILVSAIWLLLFFIMPETKNKTFDEIARALNGGQQAAPVAEEKEKVLEEEMQQFI